MIPNQFELRAGDILAMIDYGFPTNGVSSPTSFRSLLSRMEGYFEIEIAILIFCQSPASVQPGLEMSIDDEDLTCLITDYTSYQALMKRP